jgi:hypothetical protein
MMAGMAETYVVPGHVIAASTPEGEVLLNTETGQYHFLNPTGEAVLAALRQGTPLPDAAARIAADTGADTDRVLADARAFVEALRARGLVE